jgi:hypothetical protein
MITQVKTTPYVTSDGAVSSLVGLADRSKIKLSGNKPKSIARGATPSAGASKVTVDAVASMGFGSMIDVNFSANAAFYLYEALVVDPPVPGSDGGIIREEHYGVSVRICVKAWGFEGAASMSLPVMAAKASANAASLAYQVDVIGIKSSDLTGLPGLINDSIGPFDVGKLQTVGALYSQLVQFIAKKSELCRPELVAVGVDLMDLTIPYQISPSVFYGLGEIAIGKTFKDAVSKIPVVEGIPPVEEAFVRELYRVLVGTLDGVPNEGQSKFAREIIDFGHPS